MLVSGAVGAVDGVPVVPVVPLGVGERGVAGGAADAVGEPMDGGAATGGDVSPALQPATSATASAVTADRRVTQEGTFRPY
ncbi:hypothetical protein BH24ACT13_BH24ACT13_15120 [soil metagenome]